MDPRFYDNFNSSNLENDIEYTSDEDESEEIKFFKDSNSLKNSYKTYYNDTLLIINSKDRYYQGDETTYNFSINFTSMSNSLSKNATINKNFKNIVSIDLLELIIPNIYVSQREVVCLYDEGFITSKTATNENSNHIICQKISDLPYLILNMSELENNNLGTNKELNKSSFIIKYDDYKDKTNNSGSYVNDGLNVFEIGNINNSTIAISDRKLLTYKPFGELPINYNSQPRNYLKNIKIDITTPNGISLGNLSHYMTLNDIELKATSGDYNKLHITFTQHFTPDEYHLGDNIVFKDVSLDGSFERCENFLNRSSGHTIIGHDNNITGTKLYKTVIIPLDFTLDLSVTTRTVVKDNFGLNTDTSVSTTGGTMINSALQCILAMKIKTEKRDEQMLHSNII